MKLSDLLQLIEVTKKAKKLLFHQENKQIIEKLIKICYHIKSRYPWAYISLDIDKDDMGQFFVLCVQITSDYLSNRQKVNEIKMETSEYRDYDIKIQDVIVFETIGA